MNRLFGGGKNKGPSATNLQAQKSKQIESLRKVGAIEILRDVEYRVVFSQGQTNLTITISLPAAFPSEKPVVTVQPAVSHPWVDSQMKVIGCKNLNNFSMHSDLGQAVQAVLDEFKTNPPAVVPQHYVLGFNTPTICSSVTPPNPAMPTYSNQSAFPPAAPPPTGSQHPPPLPPRRVPLTGSDPPPSEPAFSMPNFTMEFPALKDMKLHELQELVEDEEKITEMVQKCPELISFTQQRETLSNDCVQLAQSNLTKKPDVQSLREEIQTKNKEQDELREEFETQCQKQMGLSEQYHPSHIQTNLKVAVMEADEESEKMAERFLEQEIDADEFLKAFMEKRTLCHLRRAKEEKLNQIIVSQGLHF